MPVAPPPTRNVEAMEPKPVAELPDAHDDVAEAVKENDEVGAVGPGGLRRGWSIGKKAAVAGAAIASAPIVLPPLVFFSALGLALSLPFALYLAGYICTQKLMRSLLSPLLSQSQERDEPFGDEDGGSVEEGRSIKEEGIMESDMVDTGNEPARDVDEIGAREEPTEVTKMVLDSREVSSSDGRPLKIQSAPAEHEIPPILELSLMSEDSGISPSVDVVEEGKPGGEATNGATIGGGKEDGKKEVEVDNLSRPIELQIENEPSSDCIVATRRSNGKVVEETLMEEMGIREEKEAEGRGSEEHSAFAAVSELGPIVYQSLAPEEHHNVGKSREDIFAIDSKRSIEKVEEVDPMEELSSIREKGANRSASDAEKPCVMVVPGEGEFETKPFSLSINDSVMDDRGRSSTELLQENQGTRIREKRQAREGKELEIEIAASPKSKEGLTSPCYSVDVISDQVNPMEELPSVEERGEVEDIKEKKGADRASSETEKPYVMVMPGEGEFETKPSNLSLNDPVTDDRDKISIKMLQEDQGTRIRENGQAEEGEELDIEVAASSKSEESQMSPCYSVDVISEEVNPMEELASVEEREVKENTEEEKGTDSSAYETEKSHVMIVPGKAECETKPFSLILTDQVGDDRDRSSTEMFQEDQRMRIGEKGQAEEGKELDIETAASPERQELVKHTENGGKMDVTRESNVCAEETETVEKGLHIVEEEEGVGFAPENKVTLDRAFAAELSFKYNVEFQQSSISTEYVSAVEDLSSDITETESKSPMEHLYLKPEPVMVAKNGEAMAPSDNEALYNEEELWHQIRALRVIVGYEAALCSSVVEELKALYLFTGVESPVPFKDNTDLMDLCDKLRFLKSVIGVE